MSKKEEKTGAQLFLARRGIEVVESIDERNKLEAPEGKVCLVLKNEEGDAQYFQRKDSHWIEPKDLKRVPRIVKPKESE